VLNHGHGKDTTWMGEGVRMTYTDSWKYFSGLSPFLPLWSLARRVRTLSKSASLVSKAEVRGCGGRGADNTKAFAKNAKEATTAGRRMFPGWTETKKRSMAYEKRTKSMFSSRSLRRARIYQKGG